MSVRAVLPGIMKTILVLDDDIGIREALSSRLHKHVKDITVLTAPNGAEGVLILRSTPVDLILTDLSMPIMDGYGVIECARKDFPAVPICVMTANCSTDAAARLHSLGIGRWIVKPFQMGKLAKMIAEELHLKINN